MFKEGPAIQLWNLINYIAAGNAANLNGTARSLYRKIGKLGRKVGIEKEEIEDDIIQAYLRADERAINAQGQHATRNGANPQPSAALEQSVEYAR